MRNLYSVIEGLLDNEEQIVSQTEEHVLISQLLDNGIYYFCSRTSRLMSSMDFKPIYKNNELSFFNEHISSAIIVDYERAKKLLSTFKIKTIRAPKITIINAGEDFSVFGNLETYSLTIVPNSKSIKNLQLTKSDPNYNGNVYKCDQKFGYNFKIDQIRFNNYVAYSSMTNEMYVDGLSKTSFSNCTLDVDHLRVNGEGAHFDNCKGTLKSIVLYSPFMFDKDFGNIIFKIFDSNYSFEHYNAKISSTTFTRKTSSLRKLLAFFGNKYYYCPETNPYKVTGSLKQILGKFDFKRLREVQIRDNNYTINFCTDFSRAQSLQNINSFKYKTNHHNTLPIEHTTDDFHCVIFFSK